MLKDEHFQKKVLENKSVKNLQKDQQLIKNKLDNLLELRLNGEIGSDVFSMKKSALSQQQDDVMSHIQKLNEKIPIRSNKQIIPESRQQSQERMAERFQTAQKRNPEILEFERIFSRWKNRAKTSETF